MGILVYDTETTGLPNWKLPSGDECQPHMVEIAGKLYNEVGFLLDSYSAIIKPDGWVIPDEVIALNGITNEMALDVGISEAEALAGFLALKAKATLRVAHNINFDDRIIRIAMKRYSTDELAEQFKAGDKFCTCQGSRAAVALPGKKIPTLGEAYKHFTGKELVNAHRAEADVDACALVFFALHPTQEPAEESTQLTAEAV